METLVCIDRDGTLIYDDKYYLGSQEDWQELIEFLPGVVEGVKSLNELNNIGIYMITNQSGIAMKDLPLLTEERAEKVCEEILTRLEQKGAHIDDYFFCPHVDPEYIEKRSEREFNDEMVCECECIKPRLGMVFDALKSKGVTRDDVNLYVIGDRASDVKTALNAGGEGILVPFENEPGEKEKVNEMFDDEVFIADDFLEAARYIVSQEQG